jgi:transposase
MHRRYPWTWNKHGKNWKGDGARILSVPVVTKKVRVPHSSLHSGNHCPGCGQGKVYVLETPGVLVRLLGQAPITGTACELEKLRRNLCLEVFTAKAPAGVGEENYDATSASMMALLKYASGLPFYRLEALQEKLEIPLPASTQ